MRFTYDIISGALIRNDWFSRRKRMHSKRKKLFLIGKRAILCDQFSNRIHGILRDTAFHSLKTHESLNSIQDWQLRKLGCPTTSPARREFSPASRSPLEQVALVYQFFFISSRLRKGIKKSREREKNRALIGVRGSFSFEPRHAKAEKRIHPVGGLSEVTCCSSVSYRNPLREKSSND